MTNRSLVVWVDDEPLLMDSELYDLETNGFEPLPFQWVGDALDWLLSAPPDLDHLRAIVIDIQMPSRGDKRFSSEDGVPVGVRLCEVLVRSNEIWPKVRPKVILYTRLPSSSPSVRFAMNFSVEHGVKFLKKTAVSRVAVELIQDRILEGRHGDAS